MILVHIDVLADPADSFGERKPNLDGMNLWTTLNEVAFHQIAVLFEGEHQSIHDQWLVRAGLSKAKMEYTGNRPLSHEVSSLMNFYGRAEWYIDVNPDNVTSVMALGIPALLVCSPRVIHSGMLPRKAPSWDTLQAELTRQRLLDAKIVVD